MTNKTITMAAATLILGLAGSAVFAQSAVPAAGATRATVPAIEGREVPQEALKKLKKKGEARKKKQQKYQAKGMVSGGNIYVRLPKGLLVMLRKAKGSPIANLYGLEGVEELAVAEMGDMIKTNQNVILTLDASGANNEAMITDVDRTGLDLWGARFDSAGNVYARGYLRIEGVPAGKTITFIFPGDKPHKFTVLIVKALGKKGGFKEKAKKAMENAHGSTTGD